MRPETLVILVEPFVSTHVHVCTALAVQSTAMHAIELQQTRGSAQRLVLLKTGLNHTRPNQLFLEK